MYINIYIYINCLPQGTRQGIETLNSKVLLNKKHLHLLVVVPHGSQKREV